MSFCQDITPTCDACYETTASECTSVTISAGLVPAATYWLWVLDKFDNAHKKQVTITAGGAFIINPSDFTSGLFNKNAGKFEAFLSTSQDSINFVNLTISGTVYKCVIIQYT